MSRMGRVDGRRVTVIGRVVQISAEVAVGPVSGSSRPRAVMNITVVVAESRGCGRVVAVAGRGRRRTRVPRPIEVGVLQPVV